MQPLAQLFVYILLAVELTRAEALHCNHDPEDIQTPKSKNSPFRIRINGNPDKYVPEGVYTGIVATPFFPISVRTVYRVQQHIVSLFSSCTVLLVCMILLLYCFSTCGEIQCERQFSH
jgi:hypothetical protein